MARVIRYEGMSRSSTRAGKIYVLRNEHMRDLIVKVGKTLKSSEDRAKELNKATGVAGKFQVLFEENVVDIDYAERLIHEQLAAYRLEPNREFFRLPYKIAIRTVFDVCTEINKDLAAKVRMVRLLLNGQSSAAKLKELLSPHLGGKVQVAVYYENKGATCEILLGDEWRIVFSPLLILVLQTWLGADNLLIVKG